MEYNISISNETMSLLDGQDDDAFLPELIKELLEQKELLSKLCKPYCQDGRGTVDANSISIEPENCGFTSDITGTLWITFNEEAYYGCRDMNIYEYRDCSLDFFLNKSEGCVVFKLTEWPEREPDEY